MLKTLPLVSIVIPTTHDRWKYNRRIIQIARNQDYVNKEIVFDHGDGMIGVKRSRLASVAKGEIICHMDSDDLYANDWVSKSVNFLLDHNADVTGLQNIRFWNEEKKKGWQYHWAGTPWMSGATMCYWRNLVKRYPFPEAQYGEDTNWLKSLPASTEILFHDYTDGFVATIHSANTMGKEVNNMLNFTILSTFEEEKIKKTWEGLLF